MRPALLVLGYALAVACCLPALLARLTSSGISARLGLAAWLTAMASVLASVVVALQYLALTLLGMEVEITATVNAVEGRRVSFSVSIKDNLEPICVGSHIRFVTDTTKTIERVKAKAAKYAARSAS